VPSALTRRASHETLIFFRHYPLNEAVNNELWPLGSEYNHRLISSKNNEKSANLDVFGA